jgi:hypothetical protein
MNTSGERKFSTGVFFEAVPYQATAVRLRN